MTTTPPSPAPAHRAARLPFYYGWVVIAVAFVTMGIAINTRTAFSLLYPPILEEFGWSRATTAAAFSIGFFASMLYSPFVGSMMDRFGPRLVIPFGATLVSGGMALAVLVTEPWHLYLTLGLLVVGGSICMSYIGHSIFLPNWFERKRGLAVGIAFSGVGVGSILLLPWLQGLIEGFGWRRACLSMAALTWVILVPLNFLLQRRHPHDLGLEPDGDRAPDGERPAREAADNVVDPAWAAVDWTLARAVRTARFWWLFLAFFSSLICWYTVQVHQTKYLSESGFAPDVAALALGMVGLMGIAGQISIGHLSDRIGREWAWTIGASGFVLCYFALLAIGRYPSPILMYVMIAAQGLLGYGLSSLSGASAMELFQGRRYGTIFGTLSLASGLGAGIGPWAAGAIFDATGSYAPAFMLAAGFGALSILCIWQAAPRKVRLVAGQAARRNRRSVTSP